MYLSTFGSFRILLIPASLWRKTKGNTTSWLLIVMIYSYFTWHLFPDALTGSLLIFTRSFLTCVSNTWFLFLWSLSAFETLTLHVVAKGALVLSFFFKACTFCSSFSPGCAWPSYTFYNIYLFLDTSYFLLHKQTSHHLRDPHDTDHDLPNLLTLVSHDQ